MSNINSDHRRILAAIAKETQPLNAAEICEKLPDLEPTFVTKGIEHLWHRGLVDHLPKKYSASDYGREVLKSTPEPEPEIETEENTQQAPAAE